MIFLFSWSGVSYGVSDPPRELPHIQRKMCSRMGGAALVAAVLAAVGILPAAGFHTPAPSTPFVRLQQCCPAPPLASRLAVDQRRRPATLWKPSAQAVCSIATEPEALDVEAADGHKIRVWRKGPPDGKPILLLHGRTWSARPVWDLQVGSPPRDGASETGASTMDLLAAHGYQSWAPDFRGLGGTERDTPGWTTPNTCQSDVKAVLDMMAAEGAEKPPLIGWSQGALVAQMVAQQYPDCISHVVLYASIFDPDVVYPPPQSGTPGLLSEDPPHVDNTMEGAMEDWTVPGIIDDEAAQAFGDTAMQWDARKVSWNGLDQFNACDPTKVTVPTLVIHGEKDMYTSMEKQGALFTGVANANKAWRVIAGCDHPVHLYPKHRLQWLRSCLSFFETPL
jgi:pimeloyl-ACP methyl ester carboxylesterase